MTMSNSSSRPKTNVDNLRAAFIWSHENDDVAQGSRACLVADPLWLARGRLSEGLAWLDAALAPESQLPNGDLARALADKAV